MQTTSRLYGPTPDSRLRPAAGRWHAQLAGGDDLYTNWQSISKLLSEYQGVSRSIKEYHGYLEYLILSPSIMRISGVSAEYHEYLDTYLRIES